MAYLIYGCPELLRCMTGTSGLLLEEIGMRPRADQVQFTSFYAINQKPVRFDMDPPGNPSKSRVADDQGCVRPGVS